MSSFKLPPRNITCIINYDYATQEEKKKNNNNKKKHFTTVISQNCFHQRIRDQIQTFGLNSAQL